MKNVLSIICVLFAALLMFSCNSNDDVLLKELKKQNAFLEEQYRQSLRLLRIQSESSPSAKPYSSLFFEQDSLMNLFMKKLFAVNKNELDKEYQLFKKTSDKHFEEANQKPESRFLESDRVLLFFKNDTLPRLVVSNDSLKRTLIKQQILQRYLIISQVCAVGSSSCLYFTNPNHFGYRLTVEKNKMQTRLELKCFDSKRKPYFSHLEYISFSKVNRTSATDALSDFQSAVIEAKTIGDALIIKTQPLQPGFYKISCYKLMITENGRLEKEEGAYDLEITENQ